ncbi:MAG: PTS sugar transporter subunit IIA [Microbacteriaceae bacterium]
MPDALDTALAESSIVVHGSADDWRDAVSQAGNALVAGGVTTDAYTGEMIAAIVELGPYVVIAPGLALAHSRPSASVNRAGLSWVSLDEAVEFGHPSNDPVDLIIGLAAPDHDGHLEIMSALAGVLSDEAALARLRAADSPTDLKRILHELSS